MPLLGIQIISIIFIFFMMYVVHIHYRKKELPIVETVFWFSSLIVLAIIVIVPETAQFVTETFAVTRLMDFIVIIAFMIIFFVLVDTRIQLYKLRKKLENNIREIAIQKAKK